MKKLPILLLSLAFSTMLGCAWGGKTKTPEVAKFDADKTFKEGNEKLKKGQYDEARESFQKLKQEDVEKSYDIVTQLRIADSYYEQGKYEEGIAAYRGFMDMHPTHKLASYAQYQIAMSYFKQISTIDRNAQFYREAMRHFQTLMANYPKSPYLDEAKERVRILTDKAAEYELYIAKFYFNKGSYRAAIGRLEGILPETPRAPIAAETLYYLAESHENLKEKDKAKEYYTMLVEKYPKEEQRFNASSRLKKLNAKR